MTEAAHGRARLSLIAAVPENGVIGADGAMPWRLPSDLRIFRRITMGKPVVMGRRTLQSIGRPLDGRDNLVVSRDPAFAMDGITVFADLETAIEEALRRAATRDPAEAIVAGGGMLYAATIDRADRLYITHVAAAPEGDTHFPAIDPALWIKVAGEPIPRSPRDNADAEFAVYERRR